jgi:FKBP12-rapamycin complex-associated protein
MAILWHEMWHEALEEASRLYFGESNVEAMLATLLPLHEMMDKVGPTTLKEIAFVQSYGRWAARAGPWLWPWQSSGVCGGGLQGLPSAGLPPGRCPAAAELPPGCGTRACA